jgi:hypothetical protein
VRSFRSNAQRPSICRTRLSIQKSRIQPGKQDLTTLNKRRTIRTPNLRSAGHYKSRGHDNREIRRSRSHYNCWYVSWEDPLQLDVSFTGFMVCVGLIKIGWVVGLPYYMALTVVHDPVGRFTRLMPFAQVLSAALGPAVSTFVIHDQQLWPVLLRASVTALTGLLVVVASTFICLRQPVRVG